MKTFHTLAGLVLLAIALLAPAVPVPAHAAQSYDNCTGFIDTLPATISTQGTWCLRHDLSTAIVDGAAITIAANNVTIDCNDFKVGGLVAGAGTNAFGISAHGRFNTTVRNCNVRGFLYGISTDGGGGHLIEHNSLDSNTDTAIDVRSPGSTIRNNRVLDTGGSTVFTIGYAYGIAAFSGVDVLDNTVDGVAATPNGSGNAMAYGIYTYDNGDGNVSGNRVHGLVASGTGSTRGIYNNSSGRLIVRDNDVQGSGVSGSIGVRCTNNLATTRDNVVAGFATGVQDCLSDGDTVNAN